MMMLVLKHVASRVKRARTHTLFAVVSGGSKSKEEKKAKKSQPQPKGHEVQKKKNKVNGFTHLVVTG